MRSDKFVRDQIERVCVGLFERDAFISPGKLIGLLIVRAAAFTHPDRTTYSARHTHASAVRSQGRPFSAR
jgi:hypothetical protein